METHSHQNHWELVEQCKRLLVELASRANAARAAGPPCRVWDFAVHDWHTTERIETLVADPARRPATQRPLRWFWEPSHFHQSLGDLMIARMFGGEATAAPRIGQLLSPENIDAWLVTARERRARYYAMEAENYRWVQEVAGEFRR
jgi:hypothetical protein